MEAIKLAKTKVILAMEKPRKKNRKFRLMYHQQNKGNEEKTSGVEDVVEEINISVKENANVKSSCHRIFRERGIL